MCMFLDWRQKVEYPQKTYHSHGREHASSKKKGTWSNWDSNLPSVKEYWGIYGKTKPCRGLSRKWGWCTWENIQSNCWWQSCIVEGSVSKFWWGRTTLGIQNRIIPGAAPFSVIPFQSCQLCDWHHCRDKMLNWWCSIFKTMGVWGGNNAHGVQEVGHTCIQAESYSIGQSVSHSLPLSAAPQPFRGVVGTVSWDKAPLSLNEVILILGISSHSLLLRPSACVCKKLCQAAFATINNDTIWSHLLRGLRLKRGVWFLGIRNETVKKWSKLWSGCRASVESHLPARSREGHSAFVAPRLHSHQEPSENKGLYFYLKTRFGSRAKEFGTASWSGLPAHAPSTHSVTLVLHLWPLPVGAHS